MKFPVRLGLSVITAVAALCAVAEMGAPFSIADYDAKLPSWGTSWKSAEGAVNGYYPTFYTGFAPRSESPERIHIRVSRGNQTRVSVILDDQTLKDYLYDLKKRSEFYAEVLTAKSGKTMVKRAPGSTPSVDYFEQIVSSPTYGILETTNAPGSDINLYKKSLEVLKSLNPGRVFELKIDLNAEFKNWQKKVRSGAIGNSGSKEIIVALNSLVWGRVNYTSQPSAEVLEALYQAIEAAKGENQEAYTQAALNLFKLATGDKYNFKVLSENDAWTNPIQCDGASCTLSYPEFTTIYPTGSHKNFTSDGNGNKIPSFATPGLWSFIDRPSHEVDNIRSDPYYGWAPKMDYEEVGNGFHNPAVRFGGSQLSGAVKKALGIDPNHNTLWSVKRGGVSHGCLRLPLGHVWEMRHILPVENEKMKQVFYFGNMSQDFDLFDIDGNGTLEVMGVEYLISYELQGEGDLARREGADLEIGSGDKLKFYTKLYGSKNVFTSNVTIENSKEVLNLTFKDPQISFPSYLDYKKKSVGTRLQMSGSYPLYEATYPRDKVQFYIPVTTNGLTGNGQQPLPKRIVRLLGRVRGCAPSSDKVACGEQAFDDEAAKILKQVYK